MEPRLPSPTSAPIVLLIHGGIAEDMDADRFWVRPGIVGAFRERDVTTIAPDRNTCPPSWEAASDELARLLAGHDVGPLPVVAGSNGCSVGARLAIDHPALVRRLVLAWPATAGDPPIDATIDPSARHLLAGETLRGVTDEELHSLTIPVSIVPSSPPNRFHRRETVDRLAALLPDVEVIRPGFPEPPHPGFGEDAHAFVDAVLRDGHRHA